MFKAISFHPSSNSFLTKVSLWLCDTALDGVGEVDGVCVVGGVCAVGVAGWVCVSCGCWLFAPLSSCSSSLSVSSCFADFVFTCFKNIWASSFILYGLQMMVESAPSSVDLAPMMAAPLSR